MKVVRCIGLALHIFCFSIGVVGTIASENQQSYFSVVLIFNAMLILYWFEINNLRGDK